MSGLTVVLLVAAVCWLMRSAFAALIPAHRLPGRVTAGLEQLPPAALAALVAQQTVDLVRASSAAAGLMSVAAVSVIAVVARRRRSLALCAVLGIASVLLLDLAHF